MARPVFYYDVYSPYSYLAASRIERLLGEVEWRPVWAYPIVAPRREGWRPPAAERRGLLDDIEDRARRYGLPPVVWPPSFAADRAEPGWSIPNTLGLARIAHWAGQQGAARAYALAAWEAIFATGAELATDLALAARIAGEVGLDAAAAHASPADPAVKQALRADTEAAIAAGVEGLPTVEIAGAFYWGDDRLDEAAAAAV